MRYKVLFLVLILWSWKGFSQIHTTDSISPILQYSDPQSRFDIKAGGRIYLDYSHENPNSYLNYLSDTDNFKNGLEVGSAELNVSGTFKKDIEFNFKVDFKGNQASVKRAYIGYKNIPYLGAVRIGYQYEPFRFSSLSSSKYSTFIEDSNNYYFLSKRNMGVLLYNDFFDHRFSFQAGLFQNGSNSGNTFRTNDGIAFTSRMVFLPYINQEKNQLLHLGVSYSYRKPKSGEYVIRIPFDSYFASTFPEEQHLFTKHVNVFNFEVVYIYQSVSFQSEYVFADFQHRSEVAISESVDFKNAGNFYTNLSWFFTGEQKKYSGGTDGFGRILPKRNFSFTEKGAGAWEMAVGFSHTRLPERVFWNGKSNDFIFGINWYLNPYSRMMFNFTHSEFGNDLALNSFQTRFQIDF